MVSRRRWRLALLVSGALASPFGLRAASADAPSPEPPRGDDGSKLESAKALFRRGTAVLEAGDLERALELFLRSRDVLPSVQNTKNAAYCLNALGRFDEALELYEELLTKFGGDLGEETRSGLGPRMQELRRKLGSVDVAATVDGIVVIDGRMRGKLPLIAPIRVLPGRHTVRVIKDSYDTFEQVITVRAVETVPIDAKLVPLGHVGRLRVAAPDLPEALFFVDGAAVGVLPWEGTLGPGEHIYFVRLGDRGSAPLAVTVVEGQSTQVSAEVKPLGAELRVLTEPMGSRLLIDGVNVAKGQWQGRLPLGKHRFEAFEAGYFAEARDVEIGSDAGSKISLKLRIDPAHPMWQKPTTVKIGLEARAAAAFSPSLGSAAEEACAAGGICSLTRGGMFAARASFEFAYGFAAEVSGGYLRISRSAARDLKSDFGPATLSTHAVYQINDSLRLSGPFGALGVGYRRSMGAHLGIHGGIQIGGLYASATDDLTIFASGGGSSTKATVEGSGALAHSFALFAMPEIDLRVDLGRLYTGIGLGAALFFLDGPQHPNGELVVDRRGALCKTYPAPIECAPGEGLLRNEQAFGRFVLVLPSVMVGYRF